MPDTRRNDGMLAPYRALDLTDEQGFLCGKILGDLGADVIKVEPPGGDRARNIGPFYDNVVDPKNSLYWWAYNANKRGVTLNLEMPAGQDIFRRLAQTADFVIESFRPGYLEDLALGYDALRVINPRLIMTSITPFGQTGPYSGYKGADIVTTALSGFMSLVGEADGPPQCVALPQSPLWAGMYAAAGALIALHHRQATGQGQHVDISAQASLLWALANAPAFWDLNQENPQRAGTLIIGRSITGAKMQAIHPCRDGYINFIIYGGMAGRRSNQALVAWMDEYGLASESLKQKDWDSFDIATATQEEIDEIERPAAALFRQLTKAEFLEGATQREILGYPVSDAGDIWGDAHLAAREFWQGVEHPDLGRAITYPGAFAKFSETPLQIRRRAPLIGEHNQEVYGDELGMSNRELAELQGAGVV